MKTDPIIKAVGIEKGAEPYLAKKGGRVLDYHVVSYLAKGRGFFEDRRTPRTPVVAGQVIYQFPGEWHCFDPDPGTRWDEYWVLFDGQRAAEFLGPLLPPRQGVFQAGLGSPLIETWRELHDIWFFKQPGYSEYALFLLHRILVELHLPRKRFHLRKPDTVVARAEHRMRFTLEHGETAFDIRAFARGEQLSYEHFRKRFRREAGLSPKRYHLDLKIQRARELLLNPRRTVKEVADTLGFDDPYYFSRLFKKKVGQSPERYREQHYRTGHKV